MCGLVSAQLRVGYFGVYVSSENGYQSFVFRRRLPSHLSMIVGVNMMVVHTHSSGLSCTMFGEVVSIIL